MEAYRTLSIIIILAVLVESARSIFSCLTWSLEGDKLSLICRIEVLDAPVSFSDQLGRQVGHCKFTGMSADCESYHKSGNINSDTFTNKIIFTLNDIKDHNIDGNWSCSQGKNSYHTEVSTSEGISPTTELYLTGAINNTGTPNIITLRCFSCREPYSNSVEFLHDHLSFDNLHYDNSSRKCFHIDGECSADTCSCARSGNEYIKILKLDSIQDSHHFSCGMRFIDNVKLVTLVKYTSLFFDGKDFIFNGTDTEEIKWNAGESSTTDVSTKPLSSTVGPKVVIKDYITELLIGTAVGVVVIVVILITCCVMKFCKSKEYKRLKDLKKGLKAKDIPTSTDEETLQLLPSNVCKESDVKSTQTISVNISEIVPKDPQADLQNKKLRWLMVGICCHNVITPALRTFVEFIMSELYISLKQSYSIDAQTHNNHLIENPKTSEKLNYEAINHNKSHRQRNDMYDYRIKNAVDLSKLYLPTELTDYEDFTSIHDPLVLLQILINIDMCPENTRSISEQICLRIQRQWSKCEFNEWNLELSASSFYLMEDLVKTFKLEANEETNLITMIKKLKDGEDCLKTSSGKNYVKQQIGTLVDNLEKICQTKQHYAAALSELRKWLHEIDDRLKKQRKQEEENFRKLVIFVEDIAANVIRKLVGYKQLHSNTSDSQFKNYLRTNAHSLYHTWCRKRCCQCEKGSNHISYPSSLLTKQKFQSLYDTDGQIVHFKLGDFCLCKVTPKQNVSLQSVDVTLADCFMKTLDNQAASNGKAILLQYMKTIKECRNELAHKASSKYFTKEQFTSRWQETEEAIVGLATGVDDEFRIKTIKKAQDLNKQHTVKYNPAHFQAIMQQYRDDLDLMIHEDHETRFDKKIDRDRIKSGISELKKLMTEHKEDALYAKTDNVRINILKYPEITKDEGRKTIEVVLQGAIPDNWDEYRMMETVRRMCEQITAGGNVIIKETTLEQFMMILEMLVEALRHEETLKKDITGLFNKILKECNIDTSQKSEINVSMDPVPDCDDRLMTVIEDDAVAIEIDEFKLIRQWDIKLQENAFITSISVVDDDNYLLIDSNNNLLIFFDNREVTKFVDLINKPWSMALMDATTIILSFPTRQEVGIFDITQKEMKEVRKVEQKLHSMAKKDDSSVLICVEDLGVCLYNFVTNQLQSLNIELPDFVPNSDEICFRNNLLYFSSRYEKKVFCYDLEGNKKWEFEHPDLKEPTTVTCDLHGNVYVTGYLSNNLFVIYNGGESHRQLLTKEDHLKLPTFLYFCPERECLLIANRDNGYVARYDIIYKKVK